MKIVFFSNFMNHHQLYFCLEMQKRLGEGFTFVATEDVPAERLALGYYDLNHRYDFILNAQDSPENAAKAKKLAETCDVMILGSAPEDYLRERMKANKLTFRFTERPLKTGRGRLLRPRSLKWMLQTHTKYCFKKLYLLGASAYAAGDFALAGAYLGKSYKWGYYPPVKRYDDLERLFELKQKSDASILWTARFIEWKHPEAPLTVAKRLRDDGYHFRMNLIGGGVLEEKIKSFIQKNGLADRVHLLGTMSPDEVRRHMEESKIFLFTSDRNEGWGAVLNEAMNSGCAVVANRAIGSVPFLIRDGENGLIYRDAQELYQKVKFLLDEKAEREKIGIHAYQTMVTLWNPETAAERFLTLSEALLNGKKLMYEEGPLSHAKLL